MANGIKYLKDVPTLSPQSIEHINDILHETGKMLAEQFAEAEHQEDLERSAVPLERNRGRLLPTVNVLIPENVYIQCPAVHPKLRPVQKCRSCEHFGGVTMQATPRPGQPLNLPWEIMHGIQCGHPTDRRCVLMEIE